jgi:hypothetical protein
MSGPTQLSYIAQGIELGIRSDGRGSLDCRPLELELGLIAQAHGSARLHLGRTDVIVGVKVGGRRRAAAAAAAPPARQPSAACPQAQGPPPLAPALHTAAAPKPGASAHTRTTAA